MTEAVFLHRDSRTLILTDLIENFERGRVHGWLLRLLTSLGGVLDPDGSTPRDLRVTFQRRTVRGAQYKPFAPAAAWRYLLPRPCNGSPGAGSPSAATGATR